MDKTGKNSLFRVEGLSYHYPNRPAVLDNTGLTLVQGERLAITGANGAGKTTLLHLLVGLKKPKAGKITAFGQQRISEADFIEVRSRAGFLFQDPDDQLFCPTVLEDIAFGPLNQGKTRQEAIAIAQGVLVELSLEGFEERITYQLSGGEKRMITLACVLAMSPDVLLLDEPTNALDTASRQRLISTLLALPQAMIIVSHDGDFLKQLATRYLVLDQGQLREDSSLSNKTIETDQSNQIWKTDNREVVACG